MIKATNIHSVTEFTRNAKSYIQQIRESHDPIALTVNGKAEVVVQDAESYQEMVDELDRIHFINAIREGQEDVRNGRVQGLEDAFADIRKELGL